MNNRLLAAGVAAACALGWAARQARAHGYAGDRFFPPTIATDDPFPVDEFAFPTVSYVRNEGPPSREIDAGFEFDKEIFPHLSLGVSDNYVYQKPSRGTIIHGWQQVVLTAKYQVAIDEEHEAIFSVGFESDLGHTGDAKVGADPFSTVAPVFYVGKGFGDLPDSLGAVRPFAVTAVIRQRFPLSAEVPNSLEYGVALEYSLLYLHQNVRDTGLPHPFRDLIPLVEFAFSTDENRATGGLTTGTINPGVLYENPYFQLGFEANIPLNSRSGPHVGFTIQAWIYIDDIFPKVFGHPLFGGSQ